MATQITSTSGAAAHAAGAEARMRATRRFVVQAPVIPPVLGLRVSEHGLAEMEPGFAVAQVEALREMGEFLREQR